MAVPARQAVVLSLLGSTIVVIAGSAYKGTLPSARRLFAIGVVYIAVASLADLKPTATKPVAGLVFLAITLHEGAGAFDAIKRVSTEGELRGAARPDPAKATEAVNLPAASPVPAGATGRPAPGGEGGNWAGSKPIAESIAAVSGLRVSSTKRSRKHTSTGGVSDHWTGSTNAYAVDLPVTGAAGDRAFKLIMTALGKPNATSGKWQTVKVGSYRIQIGWRVREHFDHIHIGVKKEG